MKIALKTVLPILACVLVVFVRVGSTQPVAEVQGTDDEPVEKSISVHMSYLFAPSYRRLKPLIRSEPTEDSAWKAIRAEALLLAEIGGNLNRRRSSNAFNPGAQENWPKNSAAVKRHGSELYRSAMKKDFDAVKRNFVAMTDSCNACHRSEVSIGSPPILTPFGKGITDNHLDP